MTARVKSDLTNIFCHYIDGETGLFDLNEKFGQIETSINFIVNKIIDRGYNMSQLELKQLTNIGEAIEVFNENVSTINSYLITISDLIGTDYLVGKEILSSMKIDIVNNNTTAGVRVNPDSIDISMSNGQSVKITEGKVESTLNEEALELTHA